MNFKISNLKLVIVNYLKNFPSLLFFVYVQLEVATRKFRHSSASCQMATEDLEDTSLLLYLAFYVSCISCFIDSLLSSKARTKTDQIFNDPYVDPHVDPYVYHCVDPHVDSFVDPRVDPIVDPCVDPIVDL